LREVGDALTFVVKERIVLGGLGRLYPLRRTIYPPRRAGVQRDAPAHPPRGGGATAPSFAPPSQSRRDGRW
jgi:hypothetical protein